MVLFSQCEITESALERMRGLLPKSSLGVNDALWITPCTSIHMFFMRFAIDAAFLDRNGKVIALYENLKPWRLSWMHPRAAGVLEVQAGALARHGVKKGEVLSLCHSS